MATAAPTKRQLDRRKAVWDSIDWMAEDRSVSFCMPAGSMTLAEFRQWTYSDDFPEFARIAWVGNEIFIDMSAELLVSHGSVKVAVYGVVGTLVRRARGGRIFFSGTRLVHPVA